MVRRLIVGSMVVILCAWGVAASEGAFNQVLIGQRNANNPAQCQWSGNWGVAANEVMLGVETGYSPPGGGWVWGNPSVSFANGTWITGTPGPPLNPWINTGLGPTNVSARTWYRDRFNVIRQAPGNVINIP